MKKLKTAFNLNLLTILFFAANGYFLHYGFFIVCFVLLMILPACSTKN